MGRVELDVKSFMESLQVIYEESNDKKDLFGKESVVIEEAIKKIDEDLKYSFNIKKPIARGGAAVICLLEDFNLKTKRALKIPRPTDDLMESVASESSYLSTIRHQNIISVYALGEVKLTSGAFDYYPYFVMDYIEGGAPDIYKVLKSKLNKAKSFEDFNDILDWLARSLLSVGRALSYLHKHDIIHFDIKPENILIDNSGYPVISDLGWAKKMSDSETEVLVGFTRFYAHPDLTKNLKYASSENRVKNYKTPKYFTKIWDTYALGKSILELLSRVESRFPQNSSCSFDFSYLHLAACRLLDGDNRNDTRMEKIIKEEEQDGHKSYYETCLGLTTSDFDKGNLRYSSIDEFVYDLEKLLGDNDLTSLIPELNHYNPDRIQASQNGSYAFTDRVSNIINQPLFTRLKNVQQLSFTSEVYPTATHSRFEHSLGVYGNTCEYIKSLYYDNFNPLFRQLVSKEDLEALLVASLLHDLGHYPLSHDMEEAGENSLSHEYWTDELLQKIDISSWEINIDEVSKILKSGRIAASFPFDITSKHQLLGAILSGAIDTDKLDYLIRDSHECCLPYGLLIDQDRLIRCLTTIITNDGVGRSFFDIGVYSKGHTAAQTLSFARYLMYQAVYWHRTVRSFRVMLILATKAALAKKQRGTKNATFLKELQRIIMDTDNKQSLNSQYMLKLIEKWTDDNGKVLIQLIRHRKPYKRILTVPEGIIKFGDKKINLDSHRARLTSPKFLDDFTTRIRKEVIKYYEDEGARTCRQPTILNFEPTEIGNKMNMGIPIIVDFPKPSEGIKRPLKIRSEPNREQKRINYTIDYRGYSSETWSNLHRNLMELASKFRIYCHPDLKEGIIHALPTESIKDILVKLLLDG